MLSVTEKLTFHWNSPAEELMDWTLTQSGLLLTVHFEPLLTITELLDAAGEKDSSVAFTLSVSGASVSL